MFAATTEEHHESNSKGKPRSQKSQGRKININLSIAECDDIDINNLISTSRLLKNSLITSHVTPRFTVNRDFDISIEIASIKDYRRVAKTLQIAFERDPFVNYILNTPIDINREDKNYKKVIKRKRDLMLSFFEYSVYECFSFDGLVVVMKDNSLESDLSSNNVKSKNMPYLGVACWNKLEFDKANVVYDYPDTSSIFDNIHPSFLKFNLFSSLARCRSKVKKDKFPYLTNIRDNVLKKIGLDSNIDSVWYLSDIGILPSMRGKGLAKILINHCLNLYIDILPNSWCYLESSNPINRKFYEKLGFAVANTFSINESELQKDNNPINMDAMLRYPKFSISFDSKDIKYDEAAITISEIVV